MATRWVEDGYIVGSPQGLARDTRLSRSRRIEMLSDWAVALADRELADREDGITRSPEQLRADRALMRAVKDALDELEADQPVQRRGPIGWLARLIGA